MENFSRQDLMAVLEAAGIEVPARASIVDLRRLYADNMDEIEIRSASGSD